MVSRRLGTSLVSSASLAANSMAMAADAPGGKAEETDGSGKPRGSPALGRDGKGKPTPWDGHNFFGGRILFCWMVLGASLHGLSHLRPRSNPKATSRESRGSGIQTLGQSPMVHGHVPSGTWPRVKARPQVLGQALRYAQWDSTPDATSTRIHFSWSLT